MVITDSLSNELYRVQLPPEAFKDKGGKGEKFKFKSDKNPQVDAEGLEKIKLRVDSEKGFVKVTVKAKDAPVQLPAGLTAMGLELGFTDQSPAGCLLWPWLPCDIESDHDDHEEKEEEVKCRSTSEY
ncbi:MAG: hypothetical protein ACE5EO_09690 [Candidatus Krumholzibacteriia bacterium]